MKKDIKKLVSWLKKPGNTSAKLASMLGYKSSTVVTQWITRGNLPHMKSAEILHIIAGGK